MEGAAGVIPSAEMKDHSCRPDRVTQPTQQGSVAGRAGAGSVIGVPRAIFYYTHPHLWETFLSGLDLPVVVSAPSTEVTVRTAARISEAEHCLPNKLFDAHLHELGPAVDRVLVPRILSTVRGHIACPKLAALPDAARVLLAGQRASVLSLEVDENRRPLLDSLADLGLELGAPPDQARAAAEGAIAAMTAAETRATDAAGESAGQRPVLILGHPYTLGDRYIAGPILGKLKRMNVPLQVMSFSRSTVRESFVKWDTSAKMYHQLLEVSPAGWAGVVQITSFNCGCDSMMIELFRSVARDRGVPYMVVMVDEHTAQGGLETRIEAFVDTTAERLARSPRPAAAGW